MKERWEQWHLRRLGVPTSMPRIGVSIFNQPVYTAVAPIPKTSYKMDYAEGAFSRKGKKVEVPYLRTSSLHLPDKKWERLVLDLTAGEAAA